MLGSANLKCHISGIILVKKCMGENPTQHVSNGWFVRDMFVFSPTHLPDDGHFSPSAVILWAISSFMKQNSLGQEINTKFPWTYTNNCYISDENIFQTTLKPRNAFADTMDFFRINVHRTADSIEICMFLSPSQVRDSITLHIECLHSTVNSSFHGRYIAASRLYMST